MSNEITSQEILNLINQQKIDYRNAVSLSVQGLTEDELTWIRHVLSSDNLDSESLTVDEKDWLKQISRVYGFDYDALIKMPPAYVRYKKSRFDRKVSKISVRRELDLLRKKMRKYKPEELIELRNKDLRKNRGIEDFTGIYIIHNLVKKSYYVGKSEGVFGRAYLHFITNPEKNRQRYEQTVKYDLSEIYDDYRSGDDFHVSLIPLQNTSFSNLDELEAYAINAYDASVEYGGYNRTDGNVMNKAIFNNSNYEKAANLILNNIKGTEIFSSLTNDEKRRKFARTLETELALPNNTHFTMNFIKLIREYQKANKKGKG